MDAASDLPDLRDPVYRAVALWLAHAGLEADDIELSHAIRSMARRLVLDDGPPVIMTPHQMLRMAMLITPTPATAVLCARLGADPARVGRELMNLARALTAAVPEGVG